MIHLHFNHYIVVFEETFDVYKLFEPLKYAYKTNASPHASPCTYTLFENRSLYFVQDKKKNAYTWGVVLTFVLHLAIYCTQLKIIPI